MFLLRGMSHILSYIGSKMENLCYILNCIGEKIEDFWYDLDFFDDLFDDYYSSATCYIMTLLLTLFVDIPVVFLINEFYGLSSPKAQQTMLFAAGIEFLICIILSILTVIMENVDYSVAYYTRAVTMSFLSVSLILAGFAAVGFLEMLIN